jgi:hypothetical protein
MMQAQLRSRLMADGTIAGLVGTRVDWDVRPQGKALPAITIAGVTFHDQHSGGPQATKRTILQVDCWALKPIDAHTLGDAVVAELQPPLEVGDTKFLGAFLTTSSSSEDTADGLVYRVMVRGDIWHTPIP